MSLFTDIRTSYMPSHVPTQKIRIWIQSSRKCVLRFCLLQRNGIWRLQKLQLSIMFSKTLRRIYILLHTLKLEIVIFLPTTSIYLFLGTMGWEWVTPVESVDSLSSSKSSFSYFQKMLQYDKMRTQCNNILDAIWREFIYSPCRLRIL